jgi:polysaccharide biosynthesis/export protein
MPPARGPVERPTPWRPLAVACCAVAVVVLASSAAAQAARPPAPRAADTVAPAAAPAAAVVGPGDRVILRVWREPQWSDSITVDGAGFVVLPRVGPFRASGLTPTALGDSVRARLAVYLRDPAIDLVVLRRVAVLGAVRKPNVYFVDPVTSLREVLAYAGGLEEGADPNGVEIQRDGVRTRIGKWRDVAESAAPVRSGDQIFVSKRPWFTRNAGTVFSSIAVAASVLLTAVRK